MCSVLAEALYKSRRELIDEFIKMDYSVVLLAPESVEEIPSDILNIPNISYYQISLQRTGLNPLADFKVIKEIRGIIKREKPSNTYAFGGAKAAIYMTEAAHLENVKNNYCMINGLGSIFRGNGLKNKIVKNIMKVLFKNSLRKSHGVLFQNEDDLTVFTKNNLVDVSKTHIVNGSGVNLNKFPYSEIVNFKTFLFIGRLLKDKGIYEFVEAAKNIKRKYPDAEFVIVGGYDDNPTSVNEDEMNEWIANGYVTYEGRQNNVYPYYKNSTAFVLPSYHEGTPRTSLEAMAVGRAIVTTDAPGCRETVIDDRNGYLVPVKNSIVLESKIENIIKDKKLAVVMGVESHKIAVEKYDVNKVNKEILKIIK